MSLGPELIINGDFSNGSNGWTVTANWDFSSNNAKAICLVDWQLHRIRQNIILEVGKSYLVSVDVSDRDVGGGDGNAFLQLPNYGSSLDDEGHYEIIYVASQTNSTFDLGMNYPLVGETVTFDNVSIRLIIENTDTPNLISGLNNFNINEKGELWP